MYHVYNGHILSQSDDTLFQKMFQTYDLDPEVPSQNQDPKQAGVTVILYQAQLHCPLVATKPRHPLVQPRHQHSTIVAGKNMGGDGKQVVQDMEVYFQIINGSRHFRFTSTCRR